jgi:hypothetical protein
MIQADALTKRNGITRAVLAALAALLVTSSGLVAKPAAGTGRSAAVADSGGAPLIVSPTNPRYFSVKRGNYERPVYLTGANLWNNLSDGAGLGSCDQPGPSFDWTAYLDFLASHRMNFVRGWRWEHVKFRLTPDLDSGGPYCVSPQPWARTGAGTAYDGGPTFDLATFNQAYFDRLRARIIEAGDRGVYVSVMLFEGFCLHLCDDDTIIAGHPFDGRNNINGIDIDSIEDYQSASVSASVLALQRAYVRKVIDTVHDLDNVLYEVANESWTGSVSWQYDVIRYVKRYETAKRHEKHPIGMSAIWPAGNDAWLFASPADWIMPGTHTGVDLEVTDDGGHRPGRPPVDPPASGHGLAGMIERAAAYGGQVEAGPLPGSGWRVRAQLHLNDSEAVM